MCNLENVYVLYPILIHLYPILTPAYYLRAVLLGGHLRSCPCPPFPGNESIFFSLVEMCAGSKLRTNTQLKLCLPEPFPLSSVHSWLTVLFFCCVFWLETSTLSTFCHRHFAHAAICQRSYRSPATGKVPIWSYGSFQIIHFEGRSGRV